MPLKKCPNCGHNVSDKAIKCPNCGCSMKDNNDPNTSNIIKCPECGAMIDKNSVTCPNCGNPINGPINIGQQYHNNYYQQNEEYGQQTYQQRPVQQTYQYTQPSQSDYNQGTMNEKPALSKGLEIAAWITWLAGIVISCTLSDVAGLGISAISLVLWIFSTLTSNSSTESKIIQIIADILWVASCFAYFLSDSEVYGIVLFVIAVVLWIIAGNIDKTEE